MRGVGRRGCLLHQSVGGEAKRILLAFALSSMHIMPKHGKPARLDYSSEFGLHRSPPYIIVPNKLVTVDAKQHTQTPLVERVDPTYIYVKRLYIYA